MTTFVIDDVLKWRDVEGDLFDVWGFCEVGPDGDCAEPSWRVVHVASGWPLRVRFFTREAAQSAVECVKRRSPPASPNDARLWRQGRRILKWAKIQGVSAPPPRLRAPAKPGSGE